MDKRKIDKEEKKSSVFTGGHQAATLGKEGMEGNPRCLEKHTWTLPASESKEEERGKINSVCKNENLLGTALDGRETCAHGGQLRFGTVQRGWRTPERNHEK